MKSVLVIIFVLIVNAVFAGTGFSSDLDLIVVLLIVIVCVLIGVDYLIKFISRRKAAKKNKPQTELADTTEETKII